MAVAAATPEAFLKENISLLIAHIHDFNHYLRGRHDESKKQLVIDLLNFISEINVSTSQMQFQHFADQNKVKIEEACRGHWSKRSDFDTLWQKFNTFVTRIPGPIATDGVTETKEEEKVKLQSYIDNFYLQSFIDNFHRYAQEKHPENKKNLVEEILTFIPNLQHEQNFATQLSNFYQGKKAIIDEACRANIGWGLSTFGTLWGEFKRFGDSLTRCVSQGQIETLNFHGRAFSTAGSATVSPPPSSAPLSSTATAFSAAPTVTTAPPAPK